MNDVIFQLPLSECIKEANAFTMDKKSTCVELEIGAINVCQILTRDRLTGEKYHIFSNLMQQALLEIFSIITPKLPKTDSEVKNQVTEVEQEDVSLLNIGLQFGGLNNEALKRIITAFQDICKSYYVGGIPNEKIPFRIIADSGEFLPPVSFFDKLSDSYYIDFNIDIIKLIENFYTKVIVSRKDKMAELGKKKIIMMR